MEATVLPDHPRLLYSFEVPVKVRTFGAQVVR